MLLLDPVAYSEAALWLLQKGDVLALDYHSQQGKTGGLPASKLSRKACWVSFLNAILRAPAHHRERKCEAQSDAVCMGWGEGRNSAGDHFVP